MKKKRNYLGIFLLSMIVISGCGKKEEDVQQELNLLGIEINAESLQRVVDKTLMNETISFKNVICRQEEDYLSCSNGENLSLSESALEKKNILVKFDDHEEISYIEASIDGQKYYYDYLEEKKEEEEKLLEKYNTGNYRLECVSYDSTSEYELQMEYTLNFSKNKLITYEQRNIYDYSSSRANVWQKALKSYQKSNDLKIDEANKKITEYLGDHHDSTNGTEEVFRKLEILESKEKLETSFDAICTIYAE